MASNYDTIIDLDPAIDTPEARLEFQNFVLSDDKQNVQGTGNQQQQLPAPAGSSAFGQQPAPPEATGGFWTVEYYQKYFNVNTTDVGQRILATLIPRQRFTDALGSNPDLYGPFWISTTVIFSLFVTSSVAGSIAAVFSNRPFEYDMRLLSFAVGTVYIYVVALPLLLWGILKYFKGPANLLELLNMYGYGLSVWIPVSFLCVSPSDIIRWVLVAVAFALSVLFKVRTIRPILSQTDDKRASTLVLSVIAIAHGGLALLFKFGFFAFVIDVSKPGDGTK
ncbi:Yip1-domain-containing protein [Gaertneriomyces semiglobifer]|nr:Yip1-domain-containing protein [Gaertneriomyces semiglobifer]